jgi:hypothetical protein
MTTEQQAKIQTVAIYARQSSGDQDDRDSLSIQAQVDALQAYAVKRGWQVVMVETDANISGRLFPDTVEARQQAPTDLALIDYLNSKDLTYRSGLGRIFDRLAEIDCLLIHDNERLYRPVDMSYQSPYMQQTLVAADVSVCVNGGDPQSFLDFNFRLISSLQNSVNDKAVRESVAKSKKAKKWLKDTGQISDGHFAMTYGYRKAEKGGVEIVAKRAATVKQIFDWYLEGHGVVWIIKALTAANVKPARTKQWNKSTVRKMLSNNAYIAHHKDSKGNLIKIDGVPAILDEGTFYRTKNMLKERAKGKTKTTSIVHPLSGLLVCPNCGKPMTIGYTQVGHSVYRCPTRHYNLTPEAKDCSRIILENSYGTNRWGNLHKSGILQTLAPIVMFAAIAENLTQKESSDDIDGETAKTKAELEALNARIEGWGEKVAEGTMDDATLMIMLPPVQRRKAELQDTLKDLLSRTGESEHNLDDFDFSGWESLYNQVIPNDSPLRKDYQTLARRYLDQVVIRDDQVQVDFVSGQSVIIPRERIQSSMSLPVVGMVKTVRIPYYTNKDDLANKVSPSHLDQIIIRYHTKKRQQSDTDNDRTRLMTVAGMTIDLIS